MISLGSRRHRRAPAIALGSAALAIVMASTTAPHAAGATAEVADGAAVGAAGGAALAGTGISPAAPVFAPRSGWQWPVAPPRVLRPFAPPPSTWASGHRGVDLAASPGDPLRAPAAGVVTYAGQLAGRGVLVIAHAGGLRSTLEPIVADVAVGAQVAAGQQVGNVGDPAVSAGSHCAALGCVHWGVLKGETYLDPLALLRGPTVLLPL